MRTAIGARASRPRATIRTASPGKNPSSAKRRPNSGGAFEFAADTDVTRAEAPGGRSGRGMSSAGDFNMTQFYMRIVPITITKSHCAFL
jgi:hypothetical protein